MIERLFMITEHNIKLCCQFFFTDCILSIREQIPEYQSTMPFLTNNDGIILCPDCVSRTVEVEKNHNRISIGSEHCNVGNELKEILAKHEDDV